MNKTLKVIGVVAVVIVIGNVVSFTAYRAKVAHSKAKMKNKR